MLGVNLQKKSWCESLENSLRNFCKKSPEEILGLNSRRMLLQFSWGVPGENPQWSSWGISPEKFLEEIPGEILKVSFQCILRKKKSLKEFLEKIPGRISGVNPWRNSWRKNTEKFVEKIPGIIPGGDLQRNSWRRFPVEFQEEIPEWFFWKINPLWNFVAIPGEIS